MRYAIIIFLLIAYAIILSAHFALYFTIVRFFNVSDEIARKTIGLLLVILSFSFIGASALIHFNQAPITKYIYVGASLWSGLLINLLIAAAAVWVIVEIADVSGLSPNTRILMTGIFIIAIIISIYGVYNSRAPKTKELSVAINNLPEAWKNEKIVQISDLHLGAILKKNYIEKIVDRINAIGPKAVFITGDYFDGSCPLLDNLAGPLNRLSTDNIYFIPGNHETYIGIDKVEKAVSQTKVKLLRSEIIELDGIEIIGLDYPLYREKINYSEILNKINETKPSILLYHEPRLQNLAKERNINLQLAGHTHNGQQIPFNVFTRLIYGKYHYGLHNDGNYNIYTTSGSGTWGPPMRLGSQSELVIFTLTN